MYNGKHMFVHSSTCNISLCFKALCLYSWIFMPENDCPIRLRRQPCIHGFFA